MGAVRRRVRRCHRTGAPPRAFGPRRAVDPASAADIFQLTKQWSANVGIEMMPWEHAMVGYIAFSILVRFSSRGPPTAAETVAVVFASLLPDLVDKPLAWQFNLFGSGHAIGHSVFAAVPAVAVALALARRRGSSRTGVAFGVAYLLHLAADVVPQSIRRGESLVGRVLWPLERDGSGYDAGFGAELTENLTDYFGWTVEQIASGDPDPYLFVLFGLFGFGVVLWVADGMPIAREIYTGLRETTRTHER